MKGSYKLLRGRLYFDTPNNRCQILSLCLEYNLRNAVTVLPIVTVGILS